MRVLGISAFYHDSAAALVEDGRCVAAAQEERFSRKRHDARYPREAIAFCLEQAGCRLEEIEHIAFYDKPLLKFERLLETYLAFAPRGFRSFRAAMPTWLKEKLFQKRLLFRHLSEEAPAVDWEKRLCFAEHHLSHAASAFFPSPFDEAAVLVMDGVGEWATTSVGQGRGRRLDLLREIQFPHSLGLLYSAFTAYTGFKVNSGESKLMGLAPYGEPRYRDVILRELVDLKADGSFRLNLDYFDYCTGLRMTNRRFERLFGGPPREPESALGQREKDLAASIQSVTEEIVKRLARHALDVTGQKTLCLAGGVALNCVANGKLLGGVEGLERLWVQPAAGDAGGALGAALVVTHLGKGLERTAPEGMAGSYLGPEFSPEEIARRLRSLGAWFETHTFASLVDRTAAALDAGSAVGWFQGRMEYGPRALGARSILADARSPSMQKTLNLKVKFRESFRPFAPAVLAERVSDWFELDGESPYMLLAARVKSDAIPAVTHVDASARVQTVHRETNPRFHALITAFEARTGCPVLVNTSFNVRGEPIVCTPEEAFRCFMGTDIDALAIGNFFLEKRAQDPALAKRYDQELEKD